MHEGLNGVLSGLTKSYTFDSFTSVKCPTVGGNREIPEVISKATMRNNDGDEFGVLAVYDGYRAGVGRVLVDAIWHHWFNIDLLGFVNVTNPAHATYDPTVIPKWEAIKAYFRNVGTWLARPKPPGLPSQRRLTDYH